MTRGHSAEHLEIAAQFRRDTTTAYAYSLGCRFGLLNNAAVVRHGAVRRVADQISAEMRADIDLVRLLGDRLALGSASLRSHLDLKNAILRANSVNASKRSTAVIQGQVEKCVAAVGSSLELRHSRERAIAFSLGWWLTRSGLAVQVKAKNAERLRDELYRKRRHEYACSNLEFVADFARDQRDAPQAVQQISDLVAQFCQQALDAHQVEAFVQAVLSDWPVRFLSYLWPAHVSVEVGPTGLHPNQLLVSALYLGNMAGRLLWLSGLPGIPDVIGLPIPRQSKPSVQATLRQHLLDLHLPWSPRLFDQVPPDRSASARDTAAVTPILGNARYYREVVLRVEQAIACLYGLRAAAFYLTGVRLGRMQQELEFEEAASEMSAGSMVGDGLHPIRAFLLSNEISEHLDILGVSDALRDRSLKAVRTLGTEGISATRLQRAAAFLGHQLGSAIADELLRKSEVEGLRIFLCHAKTDRGVVEALRTRLVNEGFSPWLDQERLLPGQDWKMAIIDAIRASHIVVVCLSEQSVSTPGFRNHELRLALEVESEQPEGTLFVIPAMLEPCSLPPSLRRFHSVDLRSPDGYGKLVKSLHAREASLQL